MSDKYFVFINNHFVNSKIIITNNNRSPLYSAILWCTQTHCALQHSPKVHVPYEKQQYIYLKKWIIILLPTLNSKRKQTENKTKHLPVVKIHLGGTEIALCFTVASEDLQNWSNQEVKVALSNESSVALRVFKSLRVAHRPWHTP